MKCKLIIQDEVNVRFDGLDADFRRRLCAKMKKELPYARHLPAVRLGRWDGKKEFFFVSGRTYLNLLDQILPEIEAKGYDIELEDLRDYQTQFEFESVEPISFDYAKWPAGHSAAGQPIVMRDHQVDVINQFLNNPQCIQEVATGAGKSLVTAALSQRCEPHGRTIVVVPNKSLITQTERDYQLLGLDVGVWYGDRKDWGRKHTICTWQSLNILIKNARNQLEAEQAGLITIGEFIQDVVAVIVDECFAGHSRVLTPGGWKQIKDIEPGDQVINLNDETGEFKTDTVVKQHRNLTNSSKEKMFKMEFDNGSIIEVTGNHKFLTTAGWVRADELTEEHEILNHGINTLR